MEINVHMHNVIHTTHIHIILNSSISNIMKNINLQKQKLVQRIYSILQETYNHFPLQFYTNAQLYDDSIFVYKQDINRSNNTLHLDISFDSSLLPQLVWDTIYVDINNQYETLMYVWKQVCIKNNKRIYIQNYIESHTLDKQSENNVEYNCSICLEEMKDSNLICKMKNCSHVFHKKCIKRWMEKSKYLDCPCCKQIQ